MSSRKENFSDFGQSAVNGLQAGENITIGDISQSIINSSSARYNHIGVIVSEYKKKVSKLERTFKDSSRANQNNIYKQLQNYYRDLHREIEHYERTIEESEKSIERVDNTQKFVDTHRKNKRNSGSSKDDLSKKNIGDVVVAGFFTYGGWQIAKTKEEAEKGIEQTKEDINELKYLISSVERYLRSGFLELDIDQIIDNNSLYNLNSSSRENIESIKEDYKTRQQELNDSYNHDLEKYKLEKNLSIYREELQYYLEENGYPLSLDNMNLLKSRLRSLELEEENVESIIEEIIKPFTAQNLKKYKAAYEDELRRENFPLSYDSAEKLEKIKCDLGLTAFAFLESEAVLIEEELAKPFYQTSFQEYRRIYKHKLEQRGLTLNSEDLLQLDKIKSRLGLKFCFCKDLDIKKAEQALIKPFYQLSLQKYSQEYKRKLYQFGLNFTENYTLELEQLRGGFGLTSAHLNNLDILGQSFPLKTDLFTVEKIAKELFYTESLQYYAQEFKREIESKLYFADQDSKLKEPLQKLGIRSEDIKIVEGLIRNNWEIEHLFYQRDSDASYWKLINSLAQYEWQKADALTRDILLKLANRSGKSVRKHPPLADRLFSTNHLQEFLAPTNHVSSKSEYSQSVLDKEAIEKISARDVYTLDRLWVEYSKGRFGFSVQKRIFNEVKQERDKFAEKIGWSNVGLIGDMFSSLPYYMFSWIPYNKLKFTLNAPEGHLPVWAAKDMKIFTDEFHHLKVWDFK